MADLIIPTRNNLPYVLKTVAPTVNDINYAVPTMWIDTTNNAFYILVDITDGVATWSS